MRKYSVLLLAASLIVSSCMSTNKNTAESHVQSDDQSNLSQLVSFKAFSPKNKIADEHAFVVTPRNKVVFIAVRNVSGEADTTIIHSDDSGLICRELSMVDANQPNHTAVALVSFKCVADTKPGTVDVHFSDLVVTEKNELFFRMSRSFYKPNSLSLESEAKLWKIDLDDPTHKMAELRAPDTAVYKSLPKASKDVNTTKIWSRDKENMALLEQKSPDTLSQRLTIMDKSGNIKFSRRNDDPDHGTYFSSPQFSFDGKKLFFLVDMFLGNNSQNIVRSASIAEVNLP